MGSMRTGVIVLIAASIGGDASAWGPPVAVRPDVQSEIAWARATWPDVFQGVRFHMPLPKLLAWVPRGGSIPAFLYTEPYDGTRGECIEVELARHRRQYDDGDEHESPVLIATIAGPPRVERARTVRDVAFVSVGAEMSQESMASTVQARDRSGRWKFSEGTVIGVPPVIFGWLSYADDRVARWDAQPLGLHVECPLDWLTCATGGGRPCQQCDRARISLRETGDELTTLRGFLPLFDSKPLPPATCQDLCPSSTDSPDIARLRRLDERVELWRPRRTRIARVASLHRSLDDCLRDHPHGARPGAEGR